MLYTTHFKFWLECNFEKWRGNKLDMAHFNAISILHEDIKENRIFTVSLFF